MASYRVVAWREIVPDTEEVTLERIPGPLARLFGARVSTQVYHGGGTVWHRYPSGRRPGVMMESMIGDMVVGYKMTAKL